MNKLALLLALVLTVFLQLQAVYVYAYNWRIAPFGASTAPTCGYTYPKSHKQIISSLGASDRTKNNYAFLPVRFNAFQLSKDAKGVTLNWKVVEEQNSRHYLIERSNDGCNFATIATILAKAGSDESAYSFHDASPLEGRSYYRLRQIDLNGHDTYSPIRAILFTIPNRLRIIQHTLAFTIYYSGEGTETYTLFNMQGHQIKTGQLVNHRSSVTALEPGIYVLSLQTQTTTISKQILIAQ